jgi:hypothetical protein
MYTVATYLVETMTKQRFSDFVQERLFNPLSMESTSIQPSQARERGFGDRIATGYKWDKREQTYHGFENPNCPEGEGAGSVVTSVNDFIKWIRVLINQERPINSKVYQGLTRLRTFINPNLTQTKPYMSPAIYAAGVGIHFNRGYAVIGHNGGIAGFGSRFFFIPEIKFGAIMFGNSEGSHEVASIMGQILIDEVLQVPHDERRQRNTFKKGAGVIKTDVPSRPKTHYQTQPSKLPKNNKKNHEGSQKKNDACDPTVNDSALSKIPLHPYLGSYWNAGYHSLVVEAKAGQLYVDATDRSFGFTLIFDHESDQTKFTAHMSDWLEGGDEKVKAEFIYEKGQVVKMGLDLEPELKQLIWFEKHSTSEDVE